MKAKPLPALTYLHECFELSPESLSGLIWKKRPLNHFPTARGWAITNGQYSGKHAGSLFTIPRTGKQYFTVMITGSAHLAHRVVYSMYYNIELPIDIEIDHRDNNGSNNSPDNLRQATREENQHNASIRKDNTSEVKGVCWHKASGMWYGRVQLNGITHNLGLSHSREVMGDIVREFREKLHREFTNHGNV